MTDVTELSHHKRKALGMVAQSLAAFGYRSLFFRFGLLVGRDIESLAFYKIGKETVLLDELIIGTFLDDLSVIQDQDAVAVLDR